jgi:hypothetical protein
MEKQILKIFKKEILKRLLAPDREEVAVEMEKTAQRKASQFTVFKKYYQKYQISGEMEGAYDEGKNVNLGARREKITWTTGSYMGV